MDKKNIYDISFRPIADAIFSISAHNTKEAREIATKELEQMSRADLIDRLLDAVNFEGLKITAITYVDDDDYYK